MDGQYDRPKSYFLHDRGVVDLDRDLPHDLNFPIIASLADAESGSSELQDIVAKNLIAGVRLERIGFGARPMLMAASAPISAATEHRRTWLRPIVDSIETDAIVTVDQFAVPGDSGGPLYLFVPKHGLFLVGLHSTWNPPADRVYSPRVE